MTEWLIVNKNLLLLSICVLVGFPFFLPLSLFKKGRKFIEWVIDKEYSNANAHLIMLIAVAISLTVIFLKGATIYHRFMAGLVFSFCMGIGAINGIRKAHGG